MKENSAEEAVKTMEHWIEYEKNNKDKINKADELINIQETILSDYKRVLKENEELKALDLSNSKIIANMSTRHFQDREKIRESIPIQKVKEKIEELDERIKNPEKNSHWASYTISECIGIRRVLQELLDNRK